MVTTLKNGGNIRVTIKSMEYSMPIFENKHKPKPLVDEVNRKTNKKIIQNERVNVFISREYMMRDNTEKAYIVVWGQCNNALQSVTKVIEEYKEKSEENDILWMLKALKKTTLVVDTKANKRVTLHKDLMTLFETRQGQKESNDGYLDHFN